MLAQFGLLRDFEIGDRELDEHFRFSADDEGSLRSVFGTEAVRDAMHVLTASENFESIRVRPERVVVRGSPRTPRLDEEPEALRTRLKIMSSDDISIVMVEPLGWEETRSLLSSDQSSTSTRAPDG